MKILHFSTAPFNDGLGYQENLLVKYHDRLFEKAILIVSDDEVISNHVGKSEFEVVRKKKLFKNSILNRLYLFNIDKEIKQFSPDIIYCHGLMSFSIITAIIYKKNNPSVKIILDNHLDDGISRLNNGSISGRVLRFIYSNLNKVLQNDYDLVYGVTPWRVDFAKNTYKINEKLCDCLPMGADDDLIPTGNKLEVNNNLKKYFNIEDKVVAVTGGKLGNDKNIIELMNSVIDNNRIVLIIFGKVDKQIEDIFNEILELSNNIIFIGMLNQKEIYDLLYSVDFAIFPGNHSVLWEQTVALGTPLITKNYNSDFFDIGNNYIAIENDVCDGINNSIDLMLNNLENYKINALNENRKKFYYSEIAKKSIKDVMGEL